MKAETVLNILGELRRCGVVSYDREYADLCRRNAQWVRDLRRSGARATGEIRQSTAMHLRKSLLDLQKASKRPTADQIGKIIEKIDAEDAMSRWMAHGR